ncbi:ATP-binding cassette domain-containing protein [Terribacillus sp. 7520-G]|uniref:iron ABC transporter ATP-binding protein n=1 Tax=Terribacillus TaxID=459532 RepID=UPI000BA5314A|nr:ATP-binding cassette domain-containing protein [Terribacillus sp. 7520-G]PAD38686.1 iron ABC transporter ATP-binding protein [Terribacillus sp. 7520-G]
MIVAEKLSKFFGSKKVIQDVSVEVKRGAITSFIGPNGAGKSTLLSMVSRLLKQDDGIVYLDGKDVHKQKSKDLAKTIAILRQSNVVQMRLTVRELVSFGRFPYSSGRLTPEDEEKVSEAIAYVNLEDLEDKYLNELSGGQKQRAFIAMVLAQDTEYILLDEPLNNLDMKHAVQMMKLLRRLVEDFGKTILLVIHDINFASVYSDRIVAMKDGRIIAEGPTEEIIQSDVLKSIYDLDIDVHNISCNRICVYF